MPDGRGKTWWNEGGPGSRGGKPREELVKRHQSKVREEGFEKGKTIWLRRDILASIEEYQKEFKERHGFRITFKDLVNEALYDLILRRRMEALHGEPVPLRDTIGTVEKKTIRKKEEQNER